MTDAFSTKWGAKAPEFPICFLLCGPGLSPLAKVPVNLANKDTTFFGALTMYYSDLR